MAETIALRDAVSAQMKEAMKAGDKTRVGALRLVIAALKDREIEARGSGKIVSRADELALLTKMVKSRQESLAIYSRPSATTSPPRKAPRSPSSASSCPSSSTKRR